MSTIRSRTASVNGVELQLLEAGDPDAPLVILAHGFPECAWSWRHQIPVLADAGYHVVAPDQRGYGHSSRPDRVEDYGIEALTGDLLGLLDDVGAEQAVFVGHDWGALVTWEVARLHPDRVKAVVGVSVPFTNWPMRPTELFKMVFGDRFFYMLYFQEVGPAEREFEADVRATMRQIMWGGSGERFQGLPAQLLPAEGTGFLDMFSDIPPGLPSWMPAEDFERFVERFEASGFFGPVSWYRNLDANYEVLKDVPPSRLTMPSFFIGGTKDAVIAQRPEMVDAMANLLPDYRGKAMLEGAGHWTQQEAPEAFNEALLGFLRSL